jgi:hypothetical protein
LKIELNKIRDFIRFDKKMKISGHEKGKKLKMSGQRGSG